MADAAGDGGGATGCRQKLAGAADRGAAVQPVHHMDQIMWGPGWVERGREERLARCAAVVAGEAWEFEGNFSATGGNRAMRADQVVWLDMPVSAQLWTVSWRKTTGPGSVRPDKAAGCSERLGREAWAFYRYIWTTRSCGRARVAGVVGQVTHKVVPLGSRAEMRAYLAGLRKAAAACFLPRFAHLCRMTETRTLRLARPADLADVDRLLARSYGRLLRRDYPPSVMVTVVPLLMRAKPGLLASGRYFVVEGAGGRLLAAGGYSLARNGLAVAAEMRHVATDPDVIRQGIGRLLVMGVFAAAKAEGVGRFHCLSSLTAVPFYAALGFVPLGLVDMPMTPAIHFPVMRMQREA